jgi:hypothetical protein
LARCIVGFEGGVGCAEGGGFADFLGFDEAVVALSVADCRDCGVSLSEYFVYNLANARFPARHRGRGGGCGVGGFAREGVGGFEVGERSLGCPISGRIGSKYFLAFIPYNFFRNDYLKEDIEAETKCHRVEIEIAFGGRVVSSGVVGPNHVGEIG